MHHRVLVVVTTFLACAPPQKPVTEGAGTPRARTATPAPEVASSAVPTPVATSSPDSELDETTLEQRRAHELAWAAAHFPEIATYASSKELDTRLTALLAWAEPAQSVTVFDRACHPALVTRYDEQLVGTLSRKITRKRGAVAESFDEITMGIRLDEFGCNSVEYERNDAHKWVVISSQGFGFWRPIGRALSKVTEDAAWYDAALIRLSIDCSGKVVEETPCADGKAKTCERCEGWKVRVHSLESSFGISRHPSVRRLQLPSVDACDVPCVVHAPPPDVQRANVVLREHEFLYTIDEDAHPLIFRTKTACQAYRKIHRFDRDELEVWRAGNPRPPDLPPPRLEEE